MSNCPPRRAKGHFDGFPEMEAFECFATTRHAGRVLGSDLDV